MISRQTFIDTFSAVNTEANMHKYLEEALNAEKLLREINDRDTNFYFAESGDTVIGYLKLNYGDSQTELVNANALEIERIYVSKEYQGQRIGKLLFEQALREAREKNLDFVWLGVWEENTKAIRFYEQNGFTEFDRHVFMLGDDKQTDIMMKLSQANANDDQ
jgi:ribosomal protein S18 acetylase RimI-like enzyme